MSKKARARREAKAAARAEKIAHNERIASIQASRRSFAWSEEIARGSGGRFTADDMRAAHRRLVERGYLAEHPEGTEITPQFFEAIGFPWTEVQAELEKEAAAAATEKG